MAPFKLKFRMGSGSKSVSQETEEPVQQPLLTRQPAISGSNTTINSDCNSMSTTNDQHTLLPVNREEEDTGYENPTIMSINKKVHGFTNIQRSLSNSTISQNNNSENTPSNMVAEQQSRSNEHLIDPTGSSDPLFANQSLEQINLDGVDVDVDEEYASCQTPQNCDETDNRSEWIERDDRMNDMYLGMSALDMIINNKSSKKIYKAVAKEWGITCQMSEHCRCMDCQSNYFNSDVYDESEHQKSDGGLGASAPVFVNEVMHHSCTII